MSLLLHVSDQAQLNVFLHGFVDGLLFNTRAQQTCWGGF